MAVEDVSGFEILSGGIPSRVCRSALFKTSLDVRHIVVSSVRWGKGPTLDVGSMGGACSDENDSC